MQPTNRKDRESNLCLSVGLWSLYSPPSTVMPCGCDFGDDIFNIFSKILNQGTFDKLNLQKKTQ